MGIPADTFAHAFGAAVPRNANNVTLRIQIRPRWASANIFTSADAVFPIQCEGPVRRLTIGYGNGNIYVEKVDATEVTVTVAGWD